MVLHHLQVNLILYVILIPKRTPRESDGLRRLLPPFKGEHQEQVRTSGPAPDLHQEQAP